MIRIEIDDRELLGALTRLIERAEHPDLAMREIGEQLTESTQARFAASTAPDGSRWAPNAQATILDHLGGRGGFSKFQSAPGREAGRCLPIWFPFVPI